MTSQPNHDQHSESNAGAGMNDNSDALHKGVRKNASHPGDASNAAGMRKEGTDRNTDTPGSSQDRQDPASDNARD